MWALLVVIAAKLPTPFPDGLPAAHPTRLEAVSPDFEGLKPPFDVVSVGIIEPTAQSESSEGSRVAVPIDEKHRIGDIMFSVSRWRNAAAGSVPWRPNTSTSSTTMVSRSIAAYGQHHSPSILTAVSSTATRDVHESEALVQPTRTLRILVTAQPSAGRVRCRPADGSTARSRNECLTANNDIASIGKGRTLVRRVN